MLQLKCNFPKKYEELGQVVQANMTSITISCLRANDAVPKHCFLVNIRTNRHRKLTEGHPGQDIKPEGLGKGKTCDSVAFPIDDFSTIKTNTSLQANTNR